MSAIWKGLIIASILMNLVSFAAEWIIVDHMLSESWKQLGVAHQMSSDQQRLRREVIELRSVCDPTADKLTY